MGSVGCPPECGFGFVCVSHFFSIWTCYAWTGYVSASDFSCCFVGIVVVVVVDVVIAVVVVTAVVMVVVGVVIAFLCLW